MGQKRTNYPRLMLAAPSSGSGKTLITCGLLEAFRRRGLKLSSFKCGPDYIDPMFHRKVIGSASANLDTFFTDEETTGYLLRRYASGSDLSLMEGVMGYYDGLGGISDKAGSYDLARVTKTPVVLILDMKGMSFSAAALLKGFAAFRKPSMIRGVILNRVSPMLYPRLKEAIEKELNGGMQDDSVQARGDGSESSGSGLAWKTEVKSPGSGLAWKTEVKSSGSVQAWRDGSESSGNAEQENRGREGAERIRVFGYVPKMGSLELKSRHLGLIMPDELSDLQEKLGDFAAQLEKTLDLDGLYALALEAEGDCGREEKFITQPADDPCVRTDSRKKVRIALAQDEAFCFAYAENLDLLEEMGAELVPFSPLSDSCLPADIDGLLLYGGYPELYAERLAVNTGMLRGLSAAVRGGLPTMAECGGFMYLMEEMEDECGRVFPAAGILHGRAFRTGKLNRFGYLSLRVKEETFSPQAQETCSRLSGTAGKAPAADRDKTFSVQGPGPGTLEQRLRMEGLGEIRGHEFHYYDTTDNGSACTASKAWNGRSWSCMHLKDNLFAGFPHLYYYSNPKLPERFLMACLDYRKREQRDASWLIRQDRENRETEKI